MTFAKSNATSFPGRANSYRFICLVVALCLIVCLTACGSASVAQKEKNEVHSFDFSAYRCLSPLSSDLLGDAETACEYASFIFEKLYPSSTYSNYVPFWIALDEEQGIWEIAFWDKDTPVGTLGGSISIYLSKATGAVLAEMKWE